MSEEKSTDPQSRAPEAESLPDENLESVSGGASIIDTGCILLPPEPCFPMPFDPTGDIVAL
ncbi:MAG TPA: hypothetical protein VF746_03465 [Longimicrobium sp.]|jgi:hypothetical protein